VRGGGPALTSVEEWYTTNAPKCVRPSPKKRLKNRRDLESNRYTTGITGVTKYL
jgi:hypothetical protein